MVIGVHPANRLPIMYIPAAAKETANLAGEKHTLACVKHKHKHPKHKQTGNLRLRKNIIIVKPVLHNA